MSPTIDPSKLKVTELREELQARGLDTKGNKPVLVKRLKKALEDELDKELPDTSIADTSTEDLDSSCVEEKNNTVETETPDRKPSIDSRTSPHESEAEQSVNNDELDEGTANTANIDELNKTANDGECIPNVSDNVTPDEGEGIDNVERKKEEPKPIQDVEMSETIEETQNEQKGEKRKRTDGSQESAPKRRERSPIKEDEPVIDPEKVLLSWYDSDLHLLVDKESFLSAKPIHEGLFGYAWAGVRATHGITFGKVRYEVKITEELKWEDFTNQRRERQEKAKERRDKEKQKEDSKNKKTDINNEELEEHKQKDETAKEENDVKEEQNEDAKVEEHEQPVEEKMDVCEKDCSKSTEKELTEEKTDTSQQGIETDKEVSEPVKEEVSEDKAEENISDDRKTDTENTTATEPLKPLEPILTHIFRAGWSMSKASLQLGEDSCSFGYESTGKFVSNREFKEFAAPYKLGDVIGAYLNITKENVEMRYTVNGELQPEIQLVSRSDLPEENFALFPHILSRNLGFELNLGAKEEPWFSCPEDLIDYPFLQAVNEKVCGPTRPGTREECEVLMMCGLPGSGKTHWVKEYLKSNADKKITVIGCSHLLDKMTVHGEPLKLSYNGRWSILLDKLQRCLNRLAEIAPQRRRNYIIDQTNVFPSAQRRKLRDFEGFKRRAVVVIVGDEEQAKRQSLKEAQDGKDVPDYAILEMKANMAIPTKGDMLEEIIFTDLNEEEAKAQITKYNNEGKAAGYQPGQRKPGFRDDRNRWSYKRNDYNRGGFRGDRGFQRFDRGPRGWGQPPPPGRFQNNRRPFPPPGLGNRDWLRNNRGPPPRPVNDRNGRDNRHPPNFRNPRQAGPPGGGRPDNWQARGGNYSQGNWGQQGNWGASTNQGWGSGYQQQGNWNSNQWKYGNNNQQQGGGYSQQQGYGQNWNNYYGQQQYTQNWTGQVSFVSHILF
ncbi:hypothetical protein WA026_016437 [Henosepilachna vigintioctopunctata]|uniref:SAP domain-containing protein n=1 Tax=Henosepilachna vigintioctopunctata TaxID=420089 RepID=A0AAW1UD19_9CUCU